MTSSIASSGDGTPWTLDAVLRSRQAVLHALDGKAHKQMPQPAGCCRQEDWYKRCRRCCLPAYLPLLLLLLLLLQRWSAMPC